MDNITSMIDYKEKRLGHLRGEAICLSCKHTWEAVTPIGTVSNLECSNCGLFKGVFQGLLVPERRWVCNCGCDLFYILPNSMQCLVCGIDVNFGSD